MAEGLNVHLQCFLVAVVLFLPSLAHGSRPAFMTPEMEQNIMKNAKAQPLELVHSERKQLQEEYGSSPASREGEECSASDVKESARMVPTGPDPLHHNGGPIKPQFP